MVAFDGLGNGSVELRTIVQLLHELNKVVALDTAEVVDCATRC